MDTVQDFIDSSLVSINQLEDSDDYGHYPFSLFVETGDGKHEINALALGGDVMACYRRFKHYLDNNAKRIYLSLDFPAAGGIEDDFVCIFSFEKNEHKICAIPYDIETGEKFKIIEKDPILDIINSQFKACLK